jgi:hypothetical protein
MNLRGKLKKINVLSIILFILIISSVSASTIGVSPSILRFDKMLKGGYAESQILVSTSFTSDIPASIEPEGDVADWISLQPENKSFFFSLNKPYRFNIIIEPPVDTANGNYTGVLKITTGELGRVNRGAGSSVLAQVSLLIYVEVIGDEIIDCRAGAISTLNAEIGDPIIIQSTVYNDGNVRLRPQVTLNVYDQYRTQLVYSESLLGSQILPTRSDIIYLEFDHDLPTGQYFADVIANDCDVIKKTTFDIVDKGQISDAGKLITIRTSDVLVEGETMVIAPMFQNLGQRRVLARFKGEIRNLKTDKIVGVLESDELQIEPNAIQEFRMLYTPKKPGEYQISGRIVYNNKITFEDASKVILVKSNGLSLFPLVFYIIGYLIIGLVILILIGRIRKERRRRRPKFKF